MQKAQQTISQTQKVRDRKNSGAEKKSKPQSRVMRQSSGVDTVGLCAEGTKIFVHGPVSQATFGLEVILP